jgi:antitoxin VapB
MSLNIKTAEAHKLAQELARETGQSMAKAVTDALREKLDSVRRRRKRANRVEEALAIGRRCAKLLKSPPVDHAELLYDEYGLPK